MGSIYLNSGMDDAARRARLHAGDLFVFAPSAATRELIALARRMLEEALAPHDPRTVHRQLSAEQVATILGRLKPAFIHHPECKRLIPAIMAEHGIDLDQVYFDVPRLRSAYPSHFLSSGIAYAFHAHRDTWYSAPMCQLNWWLPLYELDPNHAMAFYPRYFGEPVENNSQIYNYYEWNTRHRANAAQHVGADTREQPKPQQALERVTITLVPPPGGIVLFSGAQLHETVPNGTGLARYSIDFRTVHRDDVANRRGAANLNSRSTGTTMRDYLRASDLAHLPDELVALYDDGSAASGRVLHFGDRLVREAEAVAS